MTFQQPHEMLRQSMHRLLDRFDYLDEDDADYKVNLEEDTGYVRLFGIEEDDLEDCQSVMSDGFDTITLAIDEQNDGNYVVTANYNELP
jgi:6-phosphogluconolactonase (cycloisomerase 2 family)